MKEITDYEKCPKCQSLDTTEDMSKDRRFICLKCGYTGSVDEFRNHSGFENKNYSDKVMPLDVKVPNDLLTNPTLSIYSNRSEKGI